MEWWMWVVGGIALLAAEVLTPGSFFLFFFGLGGIITGVLAKLGIVTDVPMEWIVWSTVSVLSMLIFRPMLRNLMKRSGSTNMDSIVGEVASPLTDLAPGGVGQAEMRGVPWIAENVGDVPIAKGQRCRVIALEGLKVKLRAE